MSIPEELDAKGQAHGDEYAESADREYEEIIDQYGSWVEAMENLKQSNKGVVNDVQESH